MSELPLASHERTPAVLADPPWRRPRGAKPVELSGLGVPAGRPRVEWDPADRARALAYRPPLRRDEPPASEESDPERLRVLRAEYAQDGVLWMGDLSRLTPAGALALWREVAPLGWRWDQPADLEFALVHVGAAGADGFVAMAHAVPARALPVLRRLAATRLAEPIAHGLRNLKSLSGIARAWLLAFSPEAAAGLIPAALGPAGKPRANAVLAVRYLLHGGREPCLRHAARQQGRSAEAALESLIDGELLAECPAKPPALPEFFDVSRISRPLLADRSAALGDGAMRHLGEMLALSPLEPAYAGIAQVRAACDPASLARFARELMQAWLAAGGGASENWALNALGHFGDDPSARELAALVLAWPGAGFSARAEVGLDVLGSIGNDAALLNLHRIGERAKSKVLKVKAKERMVLIALTRGMAPEDVEDRLVPSFGLEADGSRVLDYGPRAFRVGFDESLTPFVRDAAGSRLPQLPKPARTDDAEKSMAAALAWRTLKKDVETAGRLHLKRFERAMVEGRRWKPATFSAALLSHPLLMHVVRRLLWGTYEDGRLAQTFRVAEDGTFADPSDGAWALPAAATLGIPHPVELGAEPAGRWARLFDDYRTVQPFPQLRRDVHTLTAEENAATALERFRGHTCAPDRVMALLGRGWKPSGTASYHGGEPTSSFTRPVAHTALVLHVALSPGVDFEDPKSSPPQTIGLVHALCGATPQPLGALGPIAASEMLRDLTALGGR